MITIDDMEAMAEDQGKTIQEVERETAQKVLEEHLVETSAFEPEPAPNGPPVKDEGTVETSNANPPMWNVGQIRRLWASGFVNRWHCNFDWRLRMSGDLNGGHCHRVMILYMGLFVHQKNTAEMIAGYFANFVTAALHDAPEVLSGDIPHPGKMAVPELKIGDKAAEVHYWRSVGSAVNWSTKSPELGVCDLLDAILFVKQRAPDLLEQKYWQGDVVVCLEMAAELGVHEEVFALIHEPWEY